MTFPFREIKPKETWKWTTTVIFFLFIFHLFLILFLQKEGLLEAHFKRFTADLYF